MIKKSTYEVFEQKIKNIVTKLDFVLTNYNSYGKYYYT